MKARLQGLSVAGWLIVVVIGGGLLFKLLAVVIGLASDLLGDRLAAILVELPIFLLCLYGVWRAVGANKVSSK